MVGDAAGDGGEVWMGGGEQVESDVWREDFGGKRRGEEAWESGLEDAKSYPEYIVSVCNEEENYR